MEDETKLQRFIHRYSEDAKPLHFNEFINMETAGLSIHISLWGGGDLYPPHRGGDKGTMVGMAHDSRQMREVVH